MNEANNAFNKQLNNLVARTLKSGVKPLDVVLEPVYDCFYGEIEGYRLNLYVNSIITGRLAPTDYMRGGAEEKLLSDVSLRAVKKAVSVVKAAAGQDKPIKNIFVRCATALLTEKDLYYRITAILKNEDLGGTNVYLEFLSEAFEYETDLLKKAFSDIRAAGLKIAADGYGGETFSIEKIINVCPDVVFTDARVAKLTTDREKTSVVAPLINLVKGLGGKVVAEGVDNDDELREFRSRDCMGFIPSENYRGNTEAVKRYVNAEDMIKEGY